MINKTVMVAAIGLALVGCGGGGNGSSNSSNATTGSGQFKDSNTSGISYVSGGLSGVTNANGDFNYELGKEITISVGNVLLGKTSGKALISPVDLVAGGNTDSLAVQHIGGFLMMLDSDQDVTNGINISTSVQNSADSWPQVDFTEADLATELSSIIPQANAADGISHILPDNSTVKLHLEKTLNCAYAGAYFGNYTGANNGNLAFMISAANGSVEGLSYNIPGNELIELSNKSAINHDQQVSFSAESSDKKVTFESKFDSLQNLSGNWQDDNNNLSGAFSATRMGGAIDATHRFTGSYDGDEYGLYSIDLDSSNKLTGAAYSVKYNQLWTITGNYSGTTFTAKASSGADITGTLNTATGALSGTWSNAALSGDFDGSGCRLN